MDWIYIFLGILALAAGLYVALYFVTGEHRRKMERLAREREQETERRLLKIKIATLRLEREQGIKPLPEDEALAKQLFDKPKRRGAFDTGNEVGWTDHLGKTFVLPNEPTEHKQRKRMHYGPDGKLVEYGHDSKGRIRPYAITEEDADRIWPPDRDRAKRDPMEPGPVHKLYRYHRGGHRLELANEILNPADIGGRTWIIKVVERHGLTLDTVRVPDQGIHAIRKLVEGKPETDLGRLRDYYKTGAEIVIVNETTMVSSGYSEPLRYDMTVEVHWPDGRKLGPITLGGLSSIEANYVRHLADHR